MLNWNIQDHGLGVAGMDATHQEFVTQVNDLIAATDGDFPQLFRALVGHTQAHFDNESRLMRECRFPAIAEHESEHRRVLGELAAMRRSLDQGRLRLVRIYVAQGLPDWFRNHLATMDAALAGCVRRMASIPTAPGPVTAG